MNLHLNRLFGIFLLAALVSCATRPARSNGAQSLTGFTYPPIEESIAEDSTFLHGLYRAYPFREVNLTGPKGYKPVYISHFGRHGSRTYVNEKEYNLIHKLFQDAYNKDLLTQTGLKFYDVFMPVYDAEIVGKVGMLTPFGKNEMARHGRDMYERYTELFYEGAKVDAKSTTVPRVIESMHIFCDTLQALAPGITLIRSSDEKHMPMLVGVVKSNPRVTQFDIDNLSTKGRWGNDYREMRRKGIDTTAFLTKFFKDPSIIYEQGSSYKALNYIQVMYNICADAICIDPTFTWLQDFYTKEEALNYWRITNLKFYAMAGPSGYSNGRTWAHIRTMLNDILANARYDLESGEYTARLRFGHDYQIVNMLTLLDVEGWNTLVAEADDVEKVFRYQQVTMASNIQFVFWQNSKGRIIVRLLFNDNDIDLPIKKVKRHYYDWNDLQEYLEERLNVAEAILNT